MPHHERHGTRRRRGDGGCVFSSWQGHGYEVIFARNVDVGAGKDGEGNVLSRTRFIAMFFLSTKEETGGGPEQG